MAYVRVPKNLTDFTPKFLFGLTVRQLLCLAGASVIGIPTFICIYRLTGSYDPATYAVIVTSLPFVAFAVFKKNGLPLEKFIGTFWRSKVVGKPIRRYQTENFYALLNEDLGMMELTEEVKTEEQEESDVIVSAEKQKKQRKKLFRRRNRSTE